ncbi:MAG: hypothetical protein IPL53_00830 [Ignavibacteria bacterium]|nr:hypothetical protein [Ignavibacteria bacterium]
MKSIYFLLILIIYFFSCGNSNTKNKPLTENSSSKADSCDGPDSDIGCCFLNMPSEINNIMNVAGSSEPGERIVIRGQILDEEGNAPYPGIIIYAYHTDNGGNYSKKGNETGFQKWHGYLHGWCMTGADGKYEIHTIKPGRYPSNDAPAHIHWAIKEPSGYMTYLNDFVFSDDSLVNKEYLSYLRLPGDDGVITLKENGSGILEGNRITKIKTQR